MSQKLYSVICEEIAVKDLEIAIERKNAC